jgi:hypothetical protein
MSQNTMSLEGGYCDSPSSAAAMSDAGPHPHDALWATATAI